MEFIAAFAIPGYTGVDVLKPRQHKVGDVGVMGKYERGRRWLVKSHSSRLVP